MGFSIGKAFSSFIKPLAQTAIKAIAPQATKALSSIVGDFFTAGKAALGGILSSSSLPSPITSLAGTLLGKVDSFLQAGGIEKYLSDLVNKLTGRTTSDGVNVTPPSLPSRLASVAAQTASVTSPAVASVVSAATGGTATTQSAAPTASGRAVSGGWGWEGGAPSPIGLDMSDPNVAAKFQSDCMKYQQCMTNMQNYYTMMSNVYKSNADTQKALNQNIR